MTNMKNFWQAYKTFVSFSIMGLILLFVGFNQTWTLTLGIINLSLISAVMAMGLTSNGVMQAFLMLELWGLRP